MVARLVYLNGMVACGDCGSQVGLVEWNGSGWVLW